MTPATAITNGDTPVDVIFVLDQTDSIDAAELDAQKAFVNDFASKINFGGNNYRIGVFSWNTNLNIHIRLLDHIQSGDLMDFQTAVNGITHSTSSSPNIGPAIMTVRQHFREGQGARSYALHVGIIMIDAGSPVFGDETTLALDENIILFGLALRSSPSTDLVNFINLLSNGFPARALNSEPGSLITNQVPEAIIAEIETCCESTWF